MIEEIPRSSPEIRHIESPSAERHGQSELALLVTFTAQRQKAESLGHRNVQQRTRNREQRRSLIIASVKRARDPAELRDSHCSPHPRIGRIFRDGTAEV